MIDAIGLGEAIVNLITIAFLCLTLLGTGVLLYFRKKFVAVVWMSIGLNLIFNFYFMGTDKVALQVVNIIIWPAINILLLVSLIVVLIKEKVHEKN